MRARPDLPGPSGRSSAWWPAFVNVSYRLRFHADRQVDAGSGGRAADSKGLSVYMTPAAFTLWGAFSHQRTHRILFDIAIVAGSLPFTMAMAGAVWYTWRRQAVAILMLMMALNFTLFHAV